MEVEKRRSRGSLLSLFDWSGKSRKKLFGNDSELSGELKKGTQNAENILKSQLSGLPIELDEKIASSSNMGCSDYNCESSANSDGGRETRGPGVVARLMGLDSLPSSSSSELASSASFDSPPLRSSHRYDRNAYDLLSDYRSVDHINLRSKLEKSWNTLESRRQKVQKRPMERFQTEILPPRSAKSIPITQHKLLSPIKSPAFICTNNAAYVMEAVAKIMEGSPRAYNVNRTPSIGSSSVPLRIVDLKEKLEAAHHASVIDRKVRPNTSNDAKGKHTDKSYSKSKLVQSSKGTGDSESSNHSRTKGKVLAIQAKKNVHSREIPVSCSNRNIVNRKEQNVKLNQCSRSQQVVQHTVQQKTSASKTNNVLVYNSQKQNAGAVKGKSAPKLPASKQPTRRTRSLNVSTGENESSSKAFIQSKSGQKRFSTSVTDDQKPLSLSKTKSTSQKKRSTRRDNLLKETIVDNVQIHFDERSVKCNITTDGSKNHYSDDMKQSMDIVSFTFTSPLRSHSTAQVMEIKNSFDLDSFRDDERPHPQALSLSSSELHMIDGGALSSILDKKLQELTFMIQSSQGNLIQEGPSAISTSASCDSVPILPGTTSKEDGKFQLDPDGDTLDGPFEGCCSSSDNSVLYLNLDLQGTESMEECYSGHSKILEIGNEVDSLYSRQGSRAVSYFQQINDCLAQKVDLELSESSSSTLTRNMSIGCGSRTCSAADFKRSNDWELEYIRDMLDKLELTGEDFILGQAYKLLTPSLYDVLESHGYHTESYRNEHSKLGRKVLFDVVNECLDLRCRQAFLGSFHAWTRWVTLVENKDTLAEDLYREMLGWTSMGELMVDELVGKDMSTRYGRWLHFGAEESEEGVEMEWTLWNSLVDELISDFLQF